VRVDHRWAEVVLDGGAEPVGELCNHSQDDPHGMDAVAAARETHDKVRSDLLKTLEMNSQGLRVVETNPQTDPRWKSFVETHPNGSIFHHPLWLEAIEREYGQRGVHFICVDARGQVQAILPMLYTRGVPFNLGGEQTGRRLSSLPRTPIAGPLSMDSQATVSLLQMAVQRVSRNPGTRLQIKTQGPELDGLIDGVVCMPWRLSYVLKLSDSLEEPFRVGKSHHRRGIKSNVHRAAKLGVHIRAAETEEDLHEWYMLYLDVMRRNTVPPRPYRFFATIWDLMQPRGMMQLLLAEQERNGRKKILAGSIFLMFGRTVSYAFNGSRFEDLSLRPNDAIFWHAINEAHRRGFQSFDFGEVEEGNSELASYKSKWGSKPVRLYRYYYVARRDLEVDAAESGGLPKLLTQAVWRRVPLKATAWLGDWIYGYL